MSSLAGKGAAPTQQIPGEGMHCGSDGDAEQLKARMDRHCVHQPSYREAEVLSTHGCSCVLAVPT